MAVIGAAVAAVAGVVSSVAGAVGVLGTVGKALIGIGLSVGVNALAGSMARSGSTPGGVQSDVSFGADVPRSIPFGRVGTTGHFIYKNSFGKNNKYLELVYVLADWPCDELEKIWVDGEEKALVAEAIPPGNTETARYHVDGYSHNGEEKFIVRFFKGRFNQAADAELVANARGSGSNRTWDDDSVAAGCCYVSVTLWYEDKLYPSGVPTLFFQLKGALLYDWRKDDTVGGSGNHRWEDVGTWEWSDNPAVCEYNYRRGFWRNGEKLLGMGVPAYDLLLDHYTAAANVCDEPTTEGGETVRRYRCSAIIADDIEYRTGVEAFTRAMAGFALEHSGQYAPVAGTSQAIVATITDDDLMVGEAVEWSKTRPRSELVNSLSGTFTDPSELWEPVAYKPLVSATWEAEDGGERLAATYDLPSVTSRFQALRVRRTYGRAMRMQAHGSIALGLRFIYLEPGDWIRWNSARYGDRTYRIAEWVKEKNQVIRLGIEETQPWVFGEDAYDGDVTPTLLNPVPSGLAATVTGLTVQATTIGGGKGQERPALHVTWDPPEDRTVTAVILEYRVANSPAVYRYRDDDPESGSHHIVQDLMGNTGYQVRATIATRPPRVTQWTAWVGMTTANVYELVDAQAAIDAAAADAAEIQQLLFDAIGGADVELINLGTLAVAQGVLESQVALNGVDVTQLRTSLTNLVTALDHRQSVRDTVAAHIEFQWFEDLESNASTLLTLATQVDDINSTLTDAGIVIDPVTGNVTITGVDGLDARLTSEVDALTGLISDRATRVELQNGLAALAAGFESSEIWTFDAGSDGWSPSAGTLTWAAGAVQIGAGGVAVSPTVAIDAAANPLIAMRIKRASGGDWDVAVEWDAGAGWVGGVAIDEPASPGSYKDVTLSLADDPAWAGTIEAIRIVTSGGSAYDVDMVRVGQSALQQLFLDDIAGTLTDLQTSIDLNSAAIESRATLAELGTESDRITTVISRVDAAEAAIALRATTAVVDDIATSVTVAQQQIDALAGTIHSLAVSTKTDDLSREVENLGRSLINWIRTGDERLNELSAGLSVASHKLSARVDSVDAARAEQLATLSAAIDGALATITAEQVARADAIAAVTADISNLEARVAANEDGTAGAVAAIASEQIARATADEAIASNLTAVEARVVTAEGAVAEAQASIADEATARATADQAEAIARQTLAARVTTAEGDIAAATAAVASESVARANADGALAATVTSLAARVDSAESGVSANEASITQESVARANGDSAVAAQVTTMQATVNGHTSTLQVHGGAIGGFAYQWGVTGTINGSTGGFTMTGIRRMGGSTTHQLLVRGDVLVDGTITGAKIAADAISANHINVSGLSAIKADMGTLTAGKIVSDNGKLEINATGGFILIRD